ncbi:PRC-barrel domain containing protein [Paracoccus sp. TOH]|uniref:PRC-barrel domain containing protein n=1 Tax=Paracoccus sp. TOH TaxID=1263728 RepID=UPI0025B0300C|nr:PRC-barrel domain containing protein [Paracoccus sp. TOH]WJS86712.1 PRC-barrel domain containing protein [Paracoccus sp. TOH]
MDHENHVRLSEDELTDAVLTGATIYGPFDDTIGTVAHLHGMGPDAQVIVDVGGFLGIGSKPVAVPVRDLDFMRDEGGSVHAVTQWTKDQLKEMPEHQH